MAIQTRQLTGPIETPEHVAVTSGELRVRLLFPIAEDTTFIAPYKLEYAITNGALPVTARVAAPGKYEFRILDETEGRIYSFQQVVYADEITPISIAELWLLSRLDDPDCLITDYENFDAALLGSDGSSAGEVLTSNGTGGAIWAPISGTGLGDMTKAVYDTNDDGCVDCADTADVAALADDASLLGGIAPSGYQEALDDAVNEGAILTWDAAENTYTPNENLQVDADGNILAGGIRLVGALYGNVYVMDIVYYLVDEETHVLITKEDDVELRLPDPVAHNGRVIEIKKGSLDGNVVSITSAGGGLIDGELTYELVHKYEAVTAVAINGEWFIF